MQCPACKAENPAQAKFCLNCGSNLTVACPQCGTELPAEARFCFGCGAAVSSVPRPVPPSPPLPTGDGEMGRQGDSKGVAPGSGFDAALQRLIPKQYAERLRAARGKVDTERRLVTLLFADVKGSTFLSETLDAEDWVEVLNGAFEFLIPPVYHYEGTVARLMGDAILAIFGAPLAHEDDPARAVYAALEIVAGMEAYAARLERERGIQGLKVRVGLNTGLAVVGEVGSSDLHVEYTAMGDAVNLAARMEQNAPPGGILITEDTYRHVRGLFDVKAQPSLTVKGKEEPLQTYLVLRARPRTFYSTTRGIEGLETRMVGRETELAVLEDLFHTAMAGTTRQVTVVGEAGVGKSRLLFEFEDWLEQQPGQLLYLRGRATPVGAHIPYSVLRDLFRDYLDIAESDDAVAVRSKFEAGLSPYLDTERAHLVGHLVGFDLSATAAVQHMAGASSLAPLALAYLTNYFRGLTTDQPVVLLLEDLHWADTPSLEFIARLTKELADRRLLVLGLARPSLYERASLPAAWSPHPPVRPEDEGQGVEASRRSDEVLMLQPLSPAASRALVDEILRQVVNIPSDLRELVVKSAEGNPFYVEELVKMLIEDGVIVPGEAAWQVEMERFKQVRVPPTLQGVLQARLDSLPEAQKVLLQRASVVGREFWDTVLTELGEEDEELGTELAAVRARELVFPRPRSTFRGAEEYRFKHALLRDTTYESVLLKLRRVYHRRVAEWLEGHVGERVSEYAGLVAEHYERARAREKAVAWLQRAGRAAWSVSAFSETLHYCERALALVPEADRATRTDLVQWIGACQDKLGNYPQAHAHYQQALELAREIGDWKTAAGALIGLSWLAQVQGDRDMGRKYAEESLAVARQSGEPGVYGQALMHWASYQEDDADALRLLEESLAIFREQGLQGREAVCRLNMGNLVYEMRDMDTAGCHYAAGLAIFRDIGNRWGAANCLGNLGLVSYWQGDYPAAMEQHQEYLNISREIGDREGIAIATNNLGHALSRLGRREEAQDYFRQSIPECRALGLVPLYLDVVVGVAWLEAEAGRLEHAAEMVGLVLNHPTKDRELEMFAEPVLALLRQEMGEGDLAAALERGQGLDLEAVVEEIEAGSG